MDVATVVGVLAPVLPYLVEKAGHVAAGEAIKKVGKEAWGLWEKLRGAVQANPAASQAVDDLAAQPDDEDLRAVLRVQLKKLLQADPSLADEVARLIVTASGDRSVAAGGDVRGTIITGDGNIVKGS